mmetsp:Transcript_12853/g.47575  ORF Transcript_12853/g.47575 Transcript_12853/m.47575 type:complete len:240 (+) Transcript_12853:1482-2201(+)
MARRLSSYCPSRASEELLCCLQEEREADAQSAAERKHLKLLDQGLGGSPDLPDSRLEVVHVENAVPIQVHDVDEAPADLVGVHRHFDPEVVFHFVPRVQQPRQEGRAGRHADERLAKGRRPSTPPCLHVETSAGQLFSHLSDGLDGAQRHKAGDHAGAEAYGVLRLQRAKDSLRAFVLDAVHEVLEALKRVVVVDGMSLACKTPKTLSVRACERGKSTRIHRKQRRKWAERAESPGTPL